MTNEETITVNDTQRDAEVAVKPNFDLLSDDKYLNGFTSTEPEVKPEVIAEENKAEEIAADLSLEPNKEEVKEEEKPTEVTTEIKPEEVVVSELEETPLTLDDVALDAQQEEELSWISLAKQDGIELAEDSLEAYKQAILEPVKSLRKEELFAELAPEHRMYMELAETGMSHDDIVAPLKNIEKYKSMSDVELYREDLIARYPQATQEWIDADVEKAIENGQAIHEATRVRLELDNVEQGIINERQQIIEKYRVNSENFLQNKRLEEVESVKKALDNMPQFMDSPLSNDVKKGLADRYVSGKYDQMFNDPAMKAKFITYIELGEKAYKNAVAKSYAKGKLEITKQLHNTPPLQTGGAGTNTIRTEGNFEKLEGDSHLRG